MNKVELIKALEDAGVTLNGDELKADLKEMYDNLETKTEKVVEEVNETVEEVVKEVKASFSLPDKLESPFNNKLDIINYVKNAVNRVEEAKVVNELQERIDFLKFMIKNKTNI